MKQLYQKIFKKKQEREPLFQIRRHIFDYESWKRWKKNKRTLQRIKSKLSRINLEKALIRKILIWAMLGIISIFWLFLINLSITEIEITRENSLIDIEESYRALNYLRGKNILSTDVSELNERLQSTQQVVRSVHMQRIFPNKVLIHIIPYTPIFNTQYGYIMDNGFIHTLPIRADVEIPFLDVVWYDISLLSRQPDISLDDLYTITVLTRSLSRDIPTLQVEGLKYYIKERELHMRDKLGTIYLFDLTENITDQIEKISVYITERWINLEEREFKYLDIRVPRWIFTCGMDNSRQCLRNLESIYGTEATQFTLQVIEENWEEDTSENETIPVE